VVRDESSPALLTAAVKPQLAGSERAIFTHIMPVRQLPAGNYLLRTKLEVADSDARTPVATLTRSFEVAAPAVLMTSADSSGAFIPPSDIYLPVSDGHLAPAFDKAEPLQPRLIDLFRDRVLPPLRTAFDEGVAALTSGDYPTAESRFKAVLQGDGESTPALVYLASVFAAAGGDTEAAGAWQTALIDGSNVPELYAWLAGALMRARQLAEARTILEEATSKWPADARFAKPLASLYATFGQGREAMRMLQRHLEAYPEDVDALALGVEWIYLLHTSGAVARTRAEDVKLARQYAETYARANGAQLALVGQWMNALENSSRR
jgi:tetratricopeptide (TPR) repeat protein